MKSNKNKRHDGYWGLILLIAFIIAIIFGTGCTKQEIAEPAFDKYEMIIDWYNLDTTNGRTKYIQVLEITNETERLKIETAKDLWYIDCNQLDVLQHLYYKKNGKKIQK